MADASHYWGGDLALSATGDLLVASGDEEAKQRILRRLLTNVDDYLWQPGYGAGLPSYIGGTLDETELTTLIRSQMLEEEGVAQTPPPEVTLQAIANGISVQIRYLSSETGLPSALSFNSTSED